MDRAAVLDAIFEAIRRTNKLRPPDDPIACAESTFLYGRRGVLDSLGLVSFLMDVEETIAARGGPSLVLADERAVALERNPFRDVASLTDFVLARLREAQP